MKFTVMSRLNAKDYTFSNCEKLPYLMISINDSHALPNMFKRDSSMVGLCILHFDDVDTGKNAMSNRDARTILDYVNTYVNKVEEIIVHCGAGVSRSAGVCAALMKVLTDDDTAIFNSSQYKPNMGCYRKVLNAYFGLPSFGSAPMVAQKYPKIDEFRFQSMRPRNGGVLSSGAVENHHEPQEKSDVYTVMTDKEVYNKQNTKTVEQETSDLFVEKAVQSAHNKLNTSKEKPYVICIKKVADIYGKALSESEHVYEYAQIDTRTALSHGYPDWGPEDGAMRFESDAAAAEWFAENKKHLMSYKQQYDWSALAIRQVSYSYIALPCEDPEPDELTLEQAKDIIAEKQKESEESAKNAAAGYDEGYYDGLAEGYEKALEILNKIKF
jgi:hypothetical protein